MIEVRNLKRGDKIKRIQPGGSAYDFIVGKEYEVYVTAGYPYVREEDGTKYDSDSLEANAAYWEHVDTEDEKVGFVRIVNTTWSPYEATEVTVHVDVAGLAAIKALETKSLKEEEARGLDAQIAHVEKQLEKLKAERETMN